MHNESSSDQGFWLLNQKWNTIFFENQKVALKLPNTKLHTNQRAQIGVHMTKVYGIVCKAWNVYEYFDRKFSGEK